MGESGRGHDEVGSADDRGWLKRRFICRWGSNVGDRVKNFARGCWGVGDAGVRVTRGSSFYETEPVDFLEQAWFLNCAVEGEAVVPGAGIAASLRGIELQMGSRKRVAKGPRLIDMDILL